MNVWHVWGDLGRRVHLTFTFGRLAGRDGEIRDLGDGRRHIVVDGRLGQEERRAVLAHELVHDERGLLDPEAPPALVAKEEWRVRAETVRRLVPEDELIDRIAVAIDADQVVTWREVAEWFDVPQNIAEHSLEELARRLRGNAA